MQGHINYLKHFNITWHLIFFKALYIYLFASHTHVNFLVAVNAVYNVLANCTKLSIHQNSYLDSFSQ